MPAKTPVAPMTRPMANISKTADSPIKAPPKAEAGPDLAAFLGTYSGQPWGGETAAIRWKGGLALMSLPSETPLRAITRLKHVEGDTFRRIRSDDDLGEAVVFERDGAGRVTGFRQHGNLSPRTR